MALSINKVTLTIQNETAMRFVRPVIYRSGSNPTQNPTTINLQTPKFGQIVLKTPQLKLILPVIKAITNVEKLLPGLLANTRIS